MKTPRNNPFLIQLRRFLFAPAAVVSLIDPTSAATNTWTGATNSNWDTSAANWTSPLVWSNGDGAVFNPGSGVVNVAANITLSGLSISGAGDTINIGTGRTLLLDYATAVPAATGGWSSKITGPGTLRLDSAQAVNGSANWGPNSATATPFSPSFTGTLILDNGRIDSSPAGLGGITAITVNSDGQFLGWTGTYPQAFTLSGDGWGEGGQPGALRSASGQNCVFNGAITLAGNAGLFTQDSTAVMTLNGVLGGTGSPTLYPRGKFNFNGTASNTYPGALGIVTAGGAPGSSTITLNKTGGAVAIPANSTINFGSAGGTNEVNLRMATGNANAQFGSGVVINFNNPNGQWTRFDLVGTSQTLAGINTGTLTTPASGIVQNREVSNNSATYGTSTLTLNGNTTDAFYPVGGYVFNGYIRDADSGVNPSNLLTLVKNGTGTQTLVGGNIGYSGNTTVNAGTLVFSRTSGLNTPIANNATVEINSVSGDDWTLNAKTLSGAGTWNKTGNGRATFSNSTVTATGQFNILAGTLRNNNNSSVWLNCKAACDISSGATLDLFADAIYFNRLTGTGTVENGYGNASPNQSGAAQYYEKLVIGTDGGSSTFSGTLRNNAGTNVAGSANAGGGLDLHKEGAGTFTVAGTLSYTGVTQITGGTLNISSPLNNTLAGAVNGGGNFIKSGAGTLTLNGANGLTGPTTVNGGTLVIGGTAPSTAITVNAGGTLRSGATGKTFTSLTVTDEGALELPAVTAQTTNAGTLALSGSPDLIVKPFFTGAPVVGSYDLLTPTSITGSPASIDTDFGPYDSARGVTGSTALSGGKLVLTVTSTFSGAANLVWNNSDGTGKWAAASPADENFDNGGSPDSFYDLDNVSFTGTAPGTITLVDTLYPASLTVNSSTGDYTFSGAGNIGGTGSLVKSGTSVLTLATSNSYTGGTTVNGGVLNANATTALGSGSLTLNAGQLNANAANAVGSGGLTLNGGILSLGNPNALPAAAPLNFPAASTATVRLNGNPLTVSQLNSASASGQIVESGSGSAGTDILTVNNATDNTFHGVIRDGSTRALALAKNAAGTLTLTGANANTYSGGTTLNVGRMGLSKTGGAVAIPGNFIGDNQASPDLFTTADNQFGSGSVMYFVSPLGDHFRFELLGTTQTLAGIDNTGAAGRGVIQHREQVPNAEVTSASKLILDVPASQTYSYDGYLRNNGAGVVSLVKNGLGKQILSGGNIDHTGGTIINAGILEFGTGNVSDQQGGFTINAGGTLQSAAATNVVGPLVLNGGTLAGIGTPLASYGHYVMANNVTVGGSQTSVISADMRCGANADRLFTVAATGDPSGIDLDVTGKIGHLNGVSWGYITKAGLGTMRFSNPTLSSDIGRITVNEGKLIFKDTIAGMGNGGLVINNSSLVEVNAGTGVELTYGGLLAGTAGSLQKTGPGSVTLTSDASTYTGNIAVSGGLLSLPARSSSYGNLTASSGATLKVAGTVDCNMTGLDLSNGSTLQVANFTGNTDTPPLVVNSNPVFTGAVGIQVPGITTPNTYPLIYYPVGGSVGGVGVGALSFSGPRSIDADLVDNVDKDSIDLVVNAINLVKWKGNTGPLWNTQGGNQNWLFEGNPTAFLNGDMVSFDDTATSFAVTIDEPITPLTVSFDHSTDYTVGVTGTGAITGNGKLTKIGTGKLTMTGAHTFTGGTTVTDGPLQLGDGTTSGSLAGVITNDANVTFNPSGAQTFPATINGTGSLTKIGSGTLNLSGPLAGSPAVPTSNSAFSGDITINGGKLVGAAVRTGSNTVFGLASSSRTITVNAGTTLEFQAANTFGNHGVTAVPTLVVNNATVTNSDPLATNRINNGLRNVTLNNGILTATVGNGTSTINTTTRPGEGYGCWGLNGTVTSSGTSVISSTVAGMGGRVLLGSHGGDTIMDVLDGTLTVSAPLQAGEGTPLGGLQKTGPGRLVLSAANIYSAPTTINGGTLELTGSLLAASGVTTASNITVASGATLKGTGTAAGTLTANGIVAPGASIGTLATGAASFGATGSLSVEINSSTMTADKLAITGNLSIDPAAALTVTDLGSGTPASGKLVIATYTGTWNNGIFAGHPDDSAIIVNGNSYVLNYNDTNAGVNAVTLTVGVADPFVNWASGYGLANGDAAKTADPDKDGVQNILEFATDSNPTSGSSGPRVYPLMFTLGADRALTYTVAVRKSAVFAASGSKQTAIKDQLLYTIEASNELTNWNTVPVTEVTGADATAIRAALGAKLTTPALGADWEWHTFRTDAGAQVDPTDFIRLQVTTSP